MTAGELRARIDLSFRAWLDVLPTTAWVIFTGTMAGLATCLVYLAAVLSEIRPEPVTFGIWCGTVAGWIGFGVRQFRVKRETDGALSHAARADASARLSGKTPAP